MQGVRYIILTLCVLATLIDYLCRSNINVTIVSMVEQGNGTKNQDTSNICVQNLRNFDQNSTTSTKGPGPKYNWSPVEQGVILGSFYATYGLFQVPGGRMAELFGGKWIIAAGVLFSGILNAITPLMAKSVILMTLSRLLLGAVQAGIFAAGYGICHSRDIATNANSINRCDCRVVSG